MKKQVVKYDDIDEMEKEALQEFLGPENSKGLSLAKLKARAKGVHRALYMDKDPTVDDSVDAEDMPVSNKNVIVGDDMITDEAATAALDPKADDQSVLHDTVTGQTVAVEGPPGPGDVVGGGRPVTRSPAEDKGVLNPPPADPQMMKLILDMQKRLEKVEAENQELKSQVNSEIGLDAAARRERKLRAFRIANHYRDTKAEEKLKKQGKWDKQPIIVARTSANEPAAHQRGLRPCAPNGGRYWHHNTEWHESPNTGETRVVTDWNPLAHVNEKNSLVLADVHGTPVKKFTDWLPLENYDEGLPRFLVMAPKAERIVVDA